MTKPPTSCFRVPAGQASPPKSLRHLQAFKSTPRIAHGFQQSAEQCVVPQAARLFASRHRRQAVGLTRPVAAGVDMRLGRASGLDQSTCRFDRQLSGRRGVFSRLVNCLEMGNLFAESFGAFVQARYLPVLLGAGEAWAWKQPKIRWALRIRQRKFSSIMHIGCEAVSPKPP